MAYKLPKDEAFCFDDVIMPPRYSEVLTRDNVDISTNLANTKLEMPFISANMDTITGWDMWKAMRYYGAFGYIHRKMPTTVRLAIAEKSIANEHPAMSVGVGRQELGIAIEMIERGVNHICIDIAHGDHLHMYRMLSWLRDRYDKSELTICAGNVCTAEGTRRLAAHGADIIKVGIGPGAVCSTRIVTGCGYPQLSAIDQCSSVAGVHIIGDGGLRNTGDIAKALAAGAHSIMSGFLFAGCDETPHTGAVKFYHGMSSAKHSKRTPEGIQASIKHKGPVKLVLKHLSEGVQSACSYQGAHNLQELRWNATFVKQTHNSVIEANTRV
jgi:IMP dehydrogenase